MDEFGYLSVLLSIIIGLAVTEILQGVRHRMLADVKVKRYWPSQLWAATLLLICTQSWWAMFGLRDRRDWSFEQFSVLLAQAVLLYLAAGLVFPDFEKHETIDMRAHYFRQRKRFFGFLIGAVCASVYREWAFNQSLPERTNLIFHCIYIAGAAIAILTAREWYHKFLAVAMSAIFLSYIGLLFARLH